MHGPICVFWANLTPFSLKGSPSAKALASGAKPAFWLFRWGKGGHLFIAGGILLLALGVLQTSPKRVMFLDVEDKGR